MTNAADIKALIPFSEKNESAQRPVAVALPLCGSNNCLAMTQAAMRGDEEAAREFFERYADRLFRYLVVVTRGEEQLARDLLSVAMIKAIGKMRPLPTDEDIWRWLTRIAWTSFIDHCRSAKRRVPTVTDETLAETHAAPEAAPESKWTEALNEAVLELGVEEREIVERYYFDEQSQTELAADANSTRKAVESRLARIRLKLRAAILRKMK